MNWYAYCRNNPVGRVDPSGLDAKEEEEECECNFDDWEDMFFSPAFKGDGIIREVEATGSISVIPALLQNIDVARSGNRVAALTSGFSWVFTIPGTTSRTAHLADDYMRSVKSYWQEFNNIAHQFSSSGRAGYKAYIEVQEYEWRITGILWWKKFERVPVGKPYWVEVRGYEGWFDPTLGLGGPIDKKIYDGFTNSTTYGYQTEKQAYAAAENAIVDYPDGTPPSFLWSDRWWDLVKKGWCPSCGKVHKSD